MSYKNPVISTNDERITSPFGWRVMNGKREHHDGIDMVDKSNLQLKNDGVDIIAYADGKVKAAGYGASVGYYADIAHEGKILTRYFHMRSGSMTVKAGDTVKRGQKLGVMGTTGNSTGVHLHFGVKENSTAYNNGVYVDPLPYLTGEKSIGSIGGVQTTQATQSVPAKTQKQQQASQGANSTVFKVGDKIKVKGGVLREWYPTIDGKKFRMWHSIYDVIQIRRDGAVVIGVDGVVTAAVKPDLLEMA